MSTETVVRERPILFSGPMVRALLDGRKSQTRRVVLARFFDRQAPKDYQRGTRIPQDGWTPELIGRDYPCPYGAPGDRLWVKEGIRFVGATAMGDLSEYEADGALTKADGWPWQRPRLASIHCPRGLSRLRLEITDVRVQRVQEISEDDARAEGMAREAWPEDVTDEDSTLNAECGYFPPRSHAAAFARLWDSLNAARGYGWDVNPWCWCLTFRRVEAR